MTCVARWKEGNKRYFVASINSRLSQWVEQKDRYQCFLYEDISNNMKMSQGQYSGTCQGLWSVLEGSRTFSMKKCKSSSIQELFFIDLLSVSSGHRCKLSQVLSTHQRWRSLNQELSIIVDSDNTSFSFLKSGTLLEQVTCHSTNDKSTDDPKDVQMVAHVKSGW